ncbi:MAG: bis(5'-nucleosyl)-tetraphosphatase (symmetrical) YqeK [Candidatus Eremiobacteraeota bacterium]|nr:bis(5'-nucleosyl)-tetraphosphatase (symmetrical) YqeK [Candidatus Eremiobacteraeota bacterium]
MTFAQLRDRVRAQIEQEHRYAHCVRVARLAERFARAHGASAPKARLAGMLHDLARLYSASRLLEECARRGIVPTDFERQNPIVLHAPLSAALASEIFGVNDDEVLSAIAKHTVAAPVMSTLDCVVYLADGLEPGRTFPERLDLARLAEIDLAAAMRGTLASSLQFYKQQGIAVSPQTLAAAHTFGLRTGTLEARTA